MYMKKTDQGEQKRTLYIQTLGTMRLTSGDEIISLHTSITGKACQLFLLLAYAGTKGITRTALQLSLIHIFLWISCPYPVMAQVLYPAE